MVYLRLIGLVLLSLALMACQADKEAVSIKYLTFADNKIKVELALSEQERFLGLSTREELCSDCGMLFVFRPARRTAFVMRDMKFPLDLLGIKDRKVVAIDENCAPDQEAVKIYQDKMVVDYVLEINAGKVKELNIKLGDEVGMID